MSGGCSRSATYYLKYFSSKAGKNPLLLYFDGISRSVSKDLLDAVAIQVLQVPADDSFGRSKAFHVADQYAAVAEPRRLCLTVLGEPFLLANARRQRSRFLTFAESDCVGEDDGAAGRFGITRREGGTSIPT
jgi:hypothetical protein